MTTIVTRASKGAPLSFTEGDANFTNLQTAIDDHVADTVGAHAASAIANTPAGGVAATTVQAAIDELDTEKATLASPALTGTPTAPTATVHTNTTQLATTAFVLAQLANGYIRLEDQKASGTQGGTSGVVDTWRTRTLNTEVQDTGSNCTLSANVFVLAAGTYYCRAKAPGFRCTSFRARLRNTTAGTTILLGDNGYSSDTGATCGWSTVEGQFTIAASQNLELQMLTKTQSANTDSNGSGPVSGVTGEVEVYSRVELWRIA
jgi:hypothetical protein